MHHYIIVLLLVCGIQVITAERGHRGSYSEPGITSLTTVKHFTFLQKLGNPCGVSQVLPMEPGRSFQTLLAFATSTPGIEFYQAMVTGILLALEKLRDLENSDPNLPHCNGLYLKSLPVTPSFDTLDIRELFKQVYRSGVYLAAHLHIMRLDRQVINSNGGFNDDQFIEDSNQFTTLRCGNESDIFATLLHDLTSKIEDILCTLISGSTMEERASYRQPYNSLLRTQIYRYHSSCSLLQTRDCLLIKETKIVLNTMGARFSRLLARTDITQLNDSDNYLFENSI